LEEFMNDRWIYRTSIIVLIVFIGIGLALNIMPPWLRQATAPGQRVRSLARAALLGGMASSTAWLSTLLVHRPRSRSKNLARGMPARRGGARRSSLRKLRTRREKKAGIIKHW
jgi:hypothetical protein